MTLFSKISLVVLIVFTLIFYFFFDFPTIDKTFLLSSNGIKEILDSYSAAEQKFYVFHCVLDFIYISAYTYLYYFYLPPKFKKFSLITCCADILENTFSLLYLWSSATSLSLLISYANFLKWMSFTLFLLILFIRFISARKRYL